MSVRIIVGSCLDVLPTLEAKSVQMCVTSPPYLWQRDYNATGQIGLEASIDEYVAALVAVFREVRRILKPDGLLWLNIGDSYAGSGKGPTGANGIGNHETRQGFHSPRLSVPAGLKRKDLMGLPWRTAFALQADGWWLRCDVIWYKPSAMPDIPLGLNPDRPDRAHEYLFLLSKSERCYYDAEAIATPLAPKTHSTHGPIRNDLGNDNLGKVKSSKFAVSMPNRKIRLTADGQPMGANRRSVWPIAGDRFDPATIGIDGIDHYAMYPPELVEPCILAGSRPGDTVIDPFFGFGTTGLVADRLQRHCIGIEINPQYADVARRRIEADAPMLADVTVETLQKEVA